MPTQQENQLKRLEHALRVRTTGAFTYRDRVTVDWLSTLTEDDFEMVARVVEYQHETGEMPDLDPEHEARYEALGQEVRQYLRDRGFDDV